MKEGCNSAWSMGRVLSCLSYSKLNVLSAPSERFGTATTNNRELIERFWKLKALYNLKKSIQCADTHNYANRWYTSIQNIRKLTNIFIQSMAKTHAHKITRTCAHARTHTHTHIGSRARTMPIKRTRTRARSHVEATYSPSMHVNTKRVRHE